MQSNLKGVWIPYEILTNENLNDKEKILYCLILFYSKKDGYCTFTNKYFANIVNLSASRVSKLITSLSRQNYIQTITNYNDSTKEVNSRKIIPLVKYYNPTCTKSTTDIAENNHSYSQKSTIPIASNSQYIRKDY